MARADFAQRKLIGTAAEIALRQLITAAGGVVICNQINRDLSTDQPGAAIAHGAHQQLHLPDLTVRWPAHPLRQFGVEVKTKTPLGHGAWGWDTHAFDRAARWSSLMGETVLYVIRDLSAAPLPPAGEVDDIEHWYAATVLKLAVSPNRLTDERFHYWPAADFVPLEVFLGLHSEISVQALPYLMGADGGPPILL